MTRKAEFGDCKLLDSAASISDDSVFSWSSDSLEDDASSSSNSSSGPLSDMSLLMANLPIKRGLSQFFQGKSQSFTSLSEASCIQDLAKKASNCIRRVKHCKRNGGLHMNQKKHYALNVCSRAISKKGLMYSCDSMLARNRSSNLFDSGSHITEKDIEFVLK